MSRLGDGAPLATGYFVKVGEHTWAEVDATSRTAASRKARAGDVVKLHYTSKKAAA